MATAATKKTAAAKSAPKKPQDRAEPKPTVKKVEGGNEVTIDDVSVIIYDSALRDWTVVNTLAKIRSGALSETDMAVSVGMVFDAILGPAQTKKVITALADEHGFTDYVQIVTFFHKMMGAASPN